MAETILYGLAKDILQKLGSLAISGIPSAWGLNFKTKLNKLKDTMETLEDVLLDAEEKQADDRAVHRWLERLGTVVYAADDLFDEHATVSARRQLMGGNKFTKEVTTFFSRYNQLAFPYKISWKIKEIWEKLDAIEKDGQRFKFVHKHGSLQRGYAMMSRMRDQTISYVNENEVIGRDDDKKAILDMLFASSSTGHQHGHDDEEVPVISIVGMGGMGKTTLAQFIYNDPQVKEFFYLRLWVCVSDDFNIKAIIEKLLKSATNNETQKSEMDQLQGLLQKEVTDKVVIQNLLQSATKGETSGSEMDQLQVKLRETVSGKRYLLVLDDVWNEQRKEWLTLRDLLKIGRKGSKILVTTRSREVAKIMGTPTPYDLQGISQDKSWKLFEKMAFHPGEAQEKPHLVKIKGDC